MQYVSRHCKFCQLFPLSSWLIYGGGENVNKYEQGEEKKVFIEFSHTKNTAIKIDGETAAACHVFLALAKGNVRRTCRHCHPLSFFTSYQLIETLQIPIFFQRVKKKKITYSLPHIYWQQC